MDNFIHTSYYNQQEFDTLLDMNGGYMFELHETHPLSMPMPLTNPIDTIPDLTTIPDLITIINPTSILEPTPIPSPIYACEYCDKTYKHLESRNYHRKQKHEPMRQIKYSCLYCDYSHDKKTLITNHLKQKHSTKDPNGFRMNDAPKQIRSATTRISKYSIQNQPFKCELCSTSFSYIMSLKAHIKMNHTVNSTFKYNCSKCIFKTDHKTVFERHCNKCV